jgi:cell division transport system permease protein
MVMTRDAFKYYVRQASKSLKKNKVTTFYSISTTVATLLILGAFLCFILNISYMTEQFSRGCQIQVFIEETADAEKYDKIGEKIKLIEGVETVEKYTKEQIFEENVEKLGDKAVILEGLRDDNPFRDSFKIEISDLELTEAVVSALEKVDGIANITDFREAAGYINAFRKTVRNISIWVVIILCIIASSIVSNAIKASVYNRRKEINIMKYVGATDWFIRWPFVVEGVIIGFYSALISLAVIYGIYFFVERSFNFQDFTLLPFTNLLPVIIVMFAIVGIGIGTVGSAISIRKHLKV